MTPRCTCTFLAVMLAAWVSSTRVAHAQTGGGEAGFESEGAEDPIDPTVADRIQRGLEYLKAAQNSDGSFGPKGVGDQLECRIGISALAGLAFLAGGNVPGRGKYGQQVERVLTYFLERASTSSSGLLSDSHDSSKMHGHGYATLFLAEVYGMTIDPLARDRIAPAIRAAIKHIVEAQEGKLKDDQLGEMGGWGYTQHDESHEGSITVCCLQALRAARDVGFKVPKHTLVKALRYLIASQNIDGSFTYRLNHGQSHSTLPLTAAAISTFNAFGVYDDTTTRVLGEDMPQIPDCMRRGLGYIDSTAFDPAALAQQLYYRRFFYYSEYYASQAYYKSRFPGHGRRWSQYYARVRRLLLERFDDTQGCWDDSEYGGAYATANATLILQIPYRYLPIFQR